jgi:4-hydroxybenzoate polyprenyltransferase
MLNSEDKFSVIIDYKLYLNIISISLLTMAGYIINAFYDFEKDMINHPETTIFGKIISKRTCLNTYIVLILLGILLTLFIGIKVFVFNLGFSFMVWVYSPNLRTNPLAAELSAWGGTLTACGGRG